MTDHQHKKDFERVSRQNSITDLARNVEEGPLGGILEGFGVAPVRSAVEATPYGRALRGRTDFENYELNQMLDLVERTNPEHLESCGKALWEARDAIKAAATELSGHIENVHWVGESGDAFREWGRTLVASTQALSDFAGGAGDQISAAAVGLASVRNSMPPRDNRSDPKALEDFPESERISSNDAYTAAVKAEKDRQEAINQMNRLSSYYSVSAEQLKILQNAVPEFKDMPDVGVPRPAPTAAQQPEYAVAPGASTTVGESSVPVHRRSVTDAVASAPGDLSGTTTSVPRITETADFDIPAAGDAVTHIDSVGTLPPPATTGASGHTSPVAGIPETGTGRSNSFGSTFAAPFPSGNPGFVGGGSPGGRTPLPAQGRTTTSKGDVSARSPERAPVSRVGHTATGHQAATSPSRGGQSSAIGRRGISGGTPRPGGTSTPDTPAGQVAGVGRQRGVVGGRQTAAPETATRTGAKIPRGTVIGGEGTTAPRSTAGRSGRGGVFGSSAATRRSTAQLGPRGNGATTEAVTGSPAARISSARAERNGMTRAGAGLVRGSGQQEKRGNQQEREEAKGPDRPVQDEGS
ncbi:hypothetical protein [Streptomyces thermoviolaceus]|uniref:hypothetical protein n=1 Tax=Streptomyces thermoviolaceus TaxID=1952 RepID=UPI00167454AA|nr:hypothetical protein [Streptomyces thermoviolaceus]GGV83821.1 hypothetical protein GCM10010499_51380 [Streptomyces thermoviolaceus subsp. apingens]